ncbi:MAG: 1-deoxy-D-xylulose 5-phosphate reductoisomerase [Desulfitibacter sp. BRH_c19]|nr:MAG: 1-deoxy-D-xylulose 5-phosphate reductoisomerase [Desulfitibacter sp. BRH_c19]
MQKNISLLGSTGSIGIQTLQVVDMFPDKFKIVSIAASGNKIELLEEQIAKYKPKIVSICNEESAKRLQHKYGSGHTKIISGLDGVVEAAVVDDADIVVAAISGAAGLIPTLAAIKNGKDVALANKETLVTAGSLVMKEVKQKGIKILPVDSEHSAIFQCLVPEQVSSIESIVLTASGGPFRKYSLKMLESVTPREALKHPNWSMGNKISIDSATLMNKGLEVIEAHWLFRMDYNRIEVVIHPQSIIHSMVRYMDGSILAHLGFPDMRIPIQYALTYPERWENQLKQLDFTEVATLTFEKPDLQKFPSLQLAYNAGKEGGIKPTVLNAANEVAVEMFLKGKIKFLHIPMLVEKSLQKSGQIVNPSLEDILAVDKSTRIETENVYTKGLINS